MAALKKRLGASVVLSFMSLMSLMLLLPRARVNQLQKITLGTSIDLSTTMDGIWNWGSIEVEDDRVEETGGGIRLVIFGDSWVDDSMDKGGSGKGKSWPEVLCEEINCTSRLNFAASQPASAFPALEPTGVATSNAVHASALKADQSIPDDTAPTTPLPDLAAQIQSFIALPVPKEAPTQTLFVLSFGFWDIYDFARMDLAVAQNATDRSIDQIFVQLDVLYRHYVEKLYPMISVQEMKSKNVTDDLPHPSFRLIIPRLFDPTLLPGWLSQRPLPVRPSSIAEQQKNAVYMTERWNSIMENRMGGWIKSPPPFPARKPSPKTETEEELEEEVSTKEVGSEISRTDVRHPESSTKISAASRLEGTVSVTARDPATASHPKSEYPEKDIFYHDTPTYLLSLIIEHNLEREGVSDANGLGKGLSPYDSVYAPCVREAEAWEGRDDSGDAEFVEANGMLVCNEPDDFLFWDAWGLGPSAKSVIGKEIGAMVKEGMSLRRAWEGIGKPA